MIQPSVPSTVANKTSSLKLYAIYPDYWKPTWGPKPCLGHLKAYDEFYARYKAYDHKLLPYNATFGPEAVEVDKKEVVTKKRKY